MLSVFFLGGGEDIYLVTNGVSDCTEVLCSSSSFETDLLDTADGLSVEKSMSIFTVLVLAKSNAKTTQRLLYN